MSRVETVIAAGTPTPALPRKRERERTADGTTTLAHMTLISGAVDISLSSRRGEPPLPLAGEGWGGGVTASEVTMGEIRINAQRVRSQRSKSREFLSEVRRFISKDGADRWVIFEDHSEP